jgi:hypothetical protein
MAFFKRQLPVFIAFVAGTVLWAQFYIPSKASQQVLEVFTTSWAIIMTGAALVLGILSAIHYHYTKLKLRKPGFGYSSVTLVTFAIVAFAGLFPIKYTGFSATTIQPDSFFNWIFLHVFVALDATMFSLLAFFIASAAFRAFRARTPEATALLIAGCIMMIGRVPVGEWLGKLPHTQIDLPAVASWILNVPNAAAQRGILLGVILSQVAISLRIIFGIERTYMGGGD